LFPADVIASNPVSSTPSVDSQPSIPQDSKHRKILQLKNEGLSLRKIGDKVGLRHSSVQSELAKHQKGRCECNKLAEMKGGNTEIQLPPNYNNTMNIA
jgi:hypothetical protein